MNKNDNFNDKGFEISRSDDYDCQTQADLYEYIMKDGYDLIDFSDRYLKSKFCNQEMDSVYSVFQREDPLQILDFVLPEIGELKRTGERGYVDPWDLGYIYRYLHFMTGCSSADLVNKIDSRTMAKELNKRTDWNIEDIADAVIKHYM